MHMFHTNTNNESWNLLYELVNDKHIPCQDFDNISLGIPCGLEIGVVSLYMSYHCLFTTGHHKQM